MQNLQPGVKSTILNATRVGERRLCCCVVFRHEMEYDLITRLRRLYKGEGLEISYVNRTYDGFRGECQLSLSTDLDVMNDSGNKGQKNQAQRKRSREHR